MRLYQTSLVVAVLMTGVASTVAVAADPVRVGGTGGAFGLLQQLGDAFSAASDIRLVNIANLGSSGAIRAVVENKLDIAVSGRPLRPEEAAKGLKAAAIVRTPYFIVTSHRNPDPLTSADLVSLYSRPNATWADGGPIRIILRPRSDSDTDVMGELFPGMADALEVARRRPEVPTAATDQDNGDMAERVMGSLTGMTGTQLKTENRRLRPLTLDGVAPTFGNYESGAYRYGKKLYFITRTGDEAESQRFMSFVQSPEGLKILRQAEVLPETP